MVVDNNAICSASSGSLMSKVNSSPLLNTPLILNPNLSDTLVACLKEPPKVFNSPPINSIEVPGLSIGDLEIK